MRAVIVCVDDEDIVRVSLREQLRRQFGTEYAIEVVESGEAALELVEELHQDNVEVALVISDQIMPGLKGDELLVKLHASLPHTVKILLTGQASAEAVGNALNHASLYRYISKPWEQSDLVLTVQEAVRSYFQTKRVEEQRRDLEQLAQNLTRKNETFFKFVPSNFLRLLGFNDDFEGVALSSSIERSMAVLFSDIRGFTPLVEGMTPQANIDFINAYLSHMEPPILDEGGFVDSYIGDAIMALFERGADSAVRAGVAMFRALERFNDARAARGQKPVRMGVGVNTGPLTLGTIGGPMRIKCGVIGDAVNLAARVESLTKHYDACMLISHHARDELTEPGRFALRIADRVVVKGRSAAVTLYEVLDADLPERREPKLANAPTYDAAVARYYARDFAGAAELFRECVARAPGDACARRFLDRSERYARDGAPEQWSGVETMEHK